MTPVPASVSQLRYTPRDRLWPMRSARPDLPNVRGTQEPRHTSSSRRLGPERRTRMALLASPKVGIRRRALLTKPSSWPASGRSLTTARNRSPISLAVTPDPGSNAWNRTPRPQPERERLSRLPLSPRVMRSCPESHCRKDDAIRESRIVSSPESEFLLCEACVLGGDDGQ